MALVLLLPPPWHPKDNGEGLLKINLWAAVLWPNQKKNDQ